MRSVDVAVVGAGPAGAAAAIELARSGREVALIDKAHFPRDKCCGDGLTTGALRQLDALGLDRSAVASWNTVDRCCVRSPSGRTVEFPFPADGVFGAVARRTDLDAALVDLAARAGAALTLGCAVTGVRASHDGAVVETDAGEIAARYLIAADGMWSPTRKALGLAEPGYLGEWHAFRQYRHAAGPDAAKLWVWFEPDLLPGYAWSFPLAGGIVNVGFGILRAHGERTRAMADTWRALRRVPHMADSLGEDSAAESPHKAWPIPARFPNASITAHEGRVLFAGDAARAADPMTGEGIGQALETGRIAAHAIVTAGPGAPSSAAASYERAMHGMVVDHRFAALLSRALGSTKGARGAVRIAGATAWTRRNFARWLFEDYPRAQILTPGRWHRGAMRAPGAFAASVGGGATPKDRGT